MDELRKFISIHFLISIAILAFSVAVGVATSIEFLGFFPNDSMLSIGNLRFVHISLMLYGAIPLLLSFLPFFLIEKEQNELGEDIFKYLNLYATTWYLFLIMMVVTILLGDNRGLPFYDFDYRLNFILALAGVFYIIALFKAIKSYDRYPLWIKVSLVVTVTAPIALLLLMNPINGAVNSTLIGPHGDNTLGMSFALIPIYYLIFKTLSKEQFQARWHICWIVPLVGYIITLIHRFFIGELSYEGEWIAQWLTLCYIPLLYRWWRDIELEDSAKLILGISILAFLFVDIEGNILFIPDFRWLFHRNDLIVGHAHIAMGLGVGFMALALYHKEIYTLSKSYFIKLFAISIVAMSFVLSLAGFRESGIIGGEVLDYWYMRTIFGFFALISFIAFIPKRLPSNKIALYNLIGFLSDGLGAVVLIFAGEWLYRMSGFHFDISTHLVIFAFMSTTATVHLFALLNHSYLLTKISAIMRIFVGAMFLSIAIAGYGGLDSWLVGGYDLVYAYIFLIMRNEKLLNIY